MFPRRSNAAARAAFAVIIALVSALAAPPVLGNTVYLWYCVRTGGHCYAEITQGQLPDGELTLSYVSSGSATETVYCQKPATGENTFDDFWFVTAPNPAGPPYLSSNWSPEWIEYAVQTGPVNGVAKPLSFFWARNYWSPSLGRYAYNEYVASGSPSLGASYSVTIQWDSSTARWQIWRGGVLQITGIASQASPGNYQALAAGAETTSQIDLSDGQVSGLADVQNGVHHTGWTGYVYLDSAVFSVSQSTSYLTYHSNNSCANG